jgi:hypothetical protein
MDGKLLFYGIAHALAACNGAKSSFVQ